MGCNSLILLSITIHGTHNLILHLSYLPIPCLAPYRGWQVSVSLVATKNATLPPILNAMEMYLVKPLTEFATDPRDARAMMEVQQNYDVKKNWMGDPCAPKAFAWEGLNCSYPPADSSKITSLNLSSSGLAGSIATYFGDLKSLQYLDLSSNDLSGPIPYNLLQKSQNGSLSLRVGYNAKLCGNGIECRSGQKKIKGPLLSAIIIPIVATVALIVVLFLLLRRVLKAKALLENREFSYREPKHITNNFSQQVGKGGFGAVFLGYLENGNPVAVKVRSESSSQGATTNKPLTWEQRLHIALDAAQGLEYVHVACKPALIHRDVKSRNILLTTNLGAKIADFGLTKSDVYSFGVVLLELITGRPPVIPIDESVSIHIGEFVHQSLDHGSIESIVDARMGGGGYDINSVWKVADLALHCKREVSRERPTMTEVVAQLKESMELESNGDRKHLVTGDDDVSMNNLGKESALEVEEQCGEISRVSPGPAVR
uniref:Protein kinase domain-containing protein n=1 Tax=Oryza meridionalis TaxID=40149 RepID=A0A0E0CFQ4_9ORYZ